MYMRDETGYNTRVKYDGWLGRNKVVDVGLNLITDALLVSPTEADIKYMAVGNQVGPTPEAAGDTGLESELDRNLVTGGGPTNSGAVITWVGDWAPGDGTGDLTEAGLFNSVSGSKLFARKTFDTRPKGATDTLTITWEVTFS
jgi:hypothetical protein